MRNSFTQQEEWLTTKSLEGMSCGAWEKGDRIPQGRAMAVYRCFLWLGIAWSKNFAGHLPRVGWFSPKEHLDPVKIEHNGYKHIHSIFIFWISFFAFLTWVRVGMLPLPAVGSKDSSRDALLKVWWILVSVTGKGGVGISTPDNLHHFGSFWNQVLRLDDDVCSIFWPFKNEHDSYTF